MPTVVYKDKDKGTIKKIQNYTVPLVTSRIVTSVMRQLEQNKYCRKDNKNVLNRTRRSNL